MESKGSTSEASEICTGSHMNRRVFPPEDPWISLESTILAGNVSLPDEAASSSIDKINDLSTVHEEAGPVCPSFELDLEPIDDDNVLNMNIDAISDDEVFFDCTTSPCLTPIKYSDSNTGKYISALSPRPYTKRKATPRYGQFLRVEDSAMATSSSNSGATAITDGSSVAVGQRTGELIVRMVDEFNDMKDHAQSTPKPEEADSGYFQLLLKSECAAGFKSPRPAAPPRNKSLPPRKSPTYKTMSPSDSRLKSSTYRVSPASRKRRLSAGKSTVDPNNKENFYRGKYSRAVTGDDSRRVVRIKKFFESRILNESLSSQKLPAKSSSSIHYKTTMCVGPRASLMRSGNALASGVSSRKKRNARPSSCSEHSNTESVASRASTNRSKSTSDATYEDSAERIKIQRANNIVRRIYSPISQRTTLHVNSPKDSTIKKRRSFGLVSSPIKPVREIRKIFSPRFQGIKTESNTCGPKHKKREKNKPLI